MDRSGHRWRRPPDVEPMRVIVDLLTDLPALADAHLAGDEAAARRSRLIAGMARVVFTDCCGIMTCGVCRPLQCWSRWRRRWPARRSNTRLKSKMNPSPWTAARPSRVTYSDAP